MGPLGQVQQRPREQNVLLTARGGGSGCAVTPSVSAERGPGGAGADAEILRLPPGAQPQPRPRPGAQCLLPGDLQRAGKRSPGPPPPPCTIPTALPLPSIRLSPPQVRDLLSPGPPCALPLRWSKTRGFYAENQLSVDFESLETIIDLLLQGAGAGTMPGGHVWEVLDLVVVVPGTGWCVPPAALHPGRFPEAPDLCARPQQALEPQPRSPDHPHPQPSREHKSCSGHKGEGWGGRIWLSGCVLLSPRTFWWG